MSPISSLEFLDSDCNLEVITALLCALNSEHVFAFSARGCKLSQEMIATLLQPAAWLTRLEQLNLVATKLGEAGTEMISAVVRSSRTLSRLNISATGTSGKLLEKVALAVGKNRSLEQLRLGSNGISGQDMKPLVNALVQNRTIRLLYLGFNSLSGDTFLADYIRSPHCILSLLNLFDCKLTPSSLFTLFQALHTNRSLTEISLGENNISSPESALALSTMLTVNTTLQTLSLDNCDLGDKGAAELARSMESGRMRVRTLEVRFNGIRTKGAEALVRAAVEARKKGAMVERIDLWGNKVGMSSKLALLTAADSSGMKVGF